MLLLVEPAVAGWVHLVELRQHGPHGFVGKVVHQLLHHHEQETFFIFFSSRNLKYYSHIHYPKATKLQQQLKKTYS